MISHRSVADYRNSRREAGGGAIVFAPRSRELDDVGKTAGDIQQLSEESLVAVPELWIACSPELDSLDDRGRRTLLNILRGVASEVDPIGWTGIGLS